MEQTMKKLLFQTLFLTTIAFTVYALFPFLGDERRPPDKGLEALELEPSVEAIFVSTYGRLVCMTELGGIGEVIDRGRNTEHDRDFYRVCVTKPLWGCTNNQIVTIMEDDVKVYHFEAFYTYTKGEGDDEYEWETATKPVLEVPSRPSIDVYPTNQSHIVFCVTKNEYAEKTSYWNHDWNVFGSNFVDKVMLPYYQPYYTTRSWWYVDYEDGIPTTFFTNLVQATHTQRNWTNYYEVLRDNRLSTSSRVKEDVKIDFGTLTDKATLEQLEYMRDDPLFPAGLRTWLEKRIDKLSPPVQP